MSAVSLGTQLESYLNNTPERPSKSKIQSLVKQCLNGELQLTAADLTQVSSILNNKGGALYDTFLRERNCFSRMIDSIVACFGGRPCSKTLTDLQTVASTQLNSRLSSPKSPNHAPLIFDPMKVTPKQMKQLSKDQIRALGSEQLLQVMPHLTDDQLRYIAPAQLNELSSKQLIALFPPARLMELTHSQLRGLMPSQIQDLATHFGREVLPANCWSLEPSVAVSNVLAMHYLLDRSCPQGTDLGSHIKSTLANCTISKRLLTDFFI